MRKVINGKRCQRDKDNSETETKTYAETETRKTIKSKLIERSDQWEKMAERQRQRCML